MKAENTLLFRLANMGSWQLLRITYLLLQAFFPLSLYAVNLWKFWINCKKCGIHFYNVLFLSRSTETYLSPEQKICWVCSLSHWTCAHLIPSNPWVKEFSVCKSNPVTFLSQHFCFLAVWLSFPKKRGYLFFKNSCFLLFCFRLEKLVAIVCARYVYFYSDLNEHCL